MAEMFLKKILELDCRLSSYKIYEGGQVFSCSQSIDKLNKLRAESLKIDDCSTVIILSVLLTNIKKNCPKNQRMYRSIAAYCVPQRACLLAATSGPTGYHLAELRQVV